MTGKPGQDLDDQSFEAWYAANYRPLYATLLAASGDRAVSSDALDEACARAFERWSRVGAMDSPTGWVYTVARNAARRSWRQLRREQTVAATQHRSPNAVGPEDSAALWDAVQRLEPRQREAIALRYILDLKERDVAATMRLRPGSVARLLHDARAQLTRALTADGVTP